MLIKNFRLESFLTTLLVLFIGLPAAVQAQTNDKARVLLPLGHTDAVTAVRYSSDARMFASASLDKTIKIWLSDRNFLLETLRGHTKAVKSIDFSPDGNLLASASLDESVRIWSVKEGVEKFKLPGHSRGALAVRFSPDGKILASGGADGAIKFWNPQTGELIKSLPAGQPETLALAFSPDGKFLAAGDRQTLKIWTAATGKEFKTFSNLPPNVSLISYSHDGRLIAAGNSDLQITVVNAETGEKVYALSDFQDTVTSAEFSRDGKFLLTGSLDKSVKIWDAATGNPVHSFEENADPVTAAVFSSNGKTVTVGDGLGAIYALDAVSGAKTAIISPRTFSLGSVAMSGDNRQLAAAGADKTIELWNLQTGKFVRLPTGHKKSIASLAFSPDGKILASGGWDNTIKLWDTASGAEIRTIEAHSSVVESVAFSPDGKSLASSGSDNKIRVWDTTSGKKLLDIDTKGALPYHSIMFSPDGKRLVGGHFYEYAVFDAQTGKTLFSNRDPQSKIAQDYALKGRNVTYSPNGEKGENALFTTISGNAAAFTADGKFLAIRASQKVSLIDASTGNVIRDFTGDFWRIKNFLFTKDGQFLIGADEENGEIHVWKTSTGEEMPQLAVHSIDGITSLNLNADGKLLTAATRDGEIIIWNVETRKELISLLATDGDDWIAATLNGYYDGSEKAEKKLAVQVQSEILGADLLKSRLSRENLLSKTVAGNQPPTDIGIPLYPEIKIKPVSAEGSPKLEIELINRGGGIGKTQVMIGGKEFIADARPAGFNPRSSRVVLTVDLSKAAKKSPAAANKITVTVFNADGDLSYKTDEIDWQF